MRRRLRLLACGALGSALVAACSSSATPSAPATTAAPGCHTGAATVSLRLSAGAPVPVVRSAPGGCIAVTVPASPFRSSSSEPPTVTPAGVLSLVSDTRHPDGTRTAYYRAAGPGTARISSTVAVRTASAVPEWSGVVQVI